MQTYIWPPNAISVSVPPLSFDRNGVATTVTQDTVTPANNRPLPAGMYINKDGVTYPVNKDTGTPANTVAVPVEIVSASGTTINITAGDIDIHTTSEGVNYDSIRVGNGSGNFLAVNATSEALVHDTDVLAQLNDMETDIENMSLKLPATLGQKTSANSMAVTIASDQSSVPTSADSLTVSGTATAINQDLAPSIDVGKYGNISIMLTGTWTGSVAVQGSNDNTNFTTVFIQPISAVTNLPQSVATVNGFYSCPVRFKYARVRVIAGPTGTVVCSTGYTQGISPIEIQYVTVAGTVPLPTGASTLAEQQTQSTQQGIVTETAPASDTASSGLNGRLQRIAQRITSLIALLPTSLGQKTMANSLAVTMASDQSAFTVTQSVKTPSYQEITNLTNSVQTFTAPANAKWAKVMTDEANTINIRVKLGGVATTTSGLQFQPGRSEDFDAAGDISVIAESAVANQKIYVQFGV